MPMDLSTSWLAHRTLNSVTPLLPARTYTCSTARGAVYHHGAHVVDWTPSGHEPVLWMSEETRLDTESTIRGGVPICWPWFGAGRNGVASPLNGFASLAEWRLVRSKQTGEAVTATYMLIDACPDKFNFPYRLVYEVRFGAEFSATLTVRNTGTRRFSFEEALHTYLRVADVQKTAVTGLDGSEYLDRASGHELGPHEQAGDVRITGETDRIYHCEGDIDVLDSKGKRRITVSRTGSHDAVLWNPWIDKARSMPDFGDDEWRGMICVETANIGEHTITLNPGKEHVMGFTLRVSDLG